MLLVVVALLVWLLWGAAIRVHSRAQLALEETLSQPPVARHAPPSAKMASVLRDADIEIAVLPSQSASVGKALRHLGLRSRTGASIVGIERNGESRINPGPDDVLHAMDQIMLLGTADQLREAKRMLTEEMAGSVSDR